MPFGAWTPRRAALAAVLILIVINLAVASMPGGIVAAIVMPLFGVEPDTKLFGAANGLIEKSTMLAAVSYTHLDVYKRQGQRPGSTPPG